MSRAAVHYCHEHPEVTFNHNAVLHRIERHLAALVEIVAGAGPETFRRWQADTRQRPAPLSLEWLGDLALFASADAEAREEAMRRVER